MAAPAPVPVYLCGSKPGVFDPTQPARLLRHPDSTLLFASFNPLTSSGPSLSADARRVVVEVTQANDFNDRPHSFSFVPSAGLGPGVASEGKWPRVVNYCGHWVVCDQDQWDIHKLDPVYDCFVPAAGLYSTIRKKISVQFSAGGAQTHPENREPSSEGSQLPPFYTINHARGDSASYRQAPTFHGCPDVPFGETTSSASPGSTASRAWLGATNGPFPPTASSAAPSSGQPLPRIPQDDEVVNRVWVEEQARVRQTGHDQSAAENAVARRQAHGTAIACLRGHTVLARLGRESHHLGLDHRQQWMPWTPQRAIDRYLAVSQLFDSARFSYEDPVDLLFIPWPVLRSPFSFHVNQLNWKMVEAFFEVAARRMGTEDYRAFLAKSQRRFHPNRWHARGLFKACDAQLAQALERACTVVLQAVNAILDDLPRPCKRY